MQVVVSTNLSLKEAIEVDEFCHSQGIAFIRLDVKGLFASVFCDFGSSFTVYDTDGEVYMPQTQL